MPVYAYKGVDTGGKTLRGHLDAENPRTARSRLKRDGIFVTDFQETRTEAAQRSGSSFRSNIKISLPNLQRVSAMDQALMTRQLATLIGAGIPLVDSLRALTDQTENQRLKSELAKVRDRVNEGGTLADALAASGIFSDLFIGMVRAGEASGALQVVLDRLADYLEAQVRLRNRVSSIMIYPLFMMAFAMLVVGVLVTVVLPQITELLVDLDQPLPFFTRWIIGASNFVREWWWAIGVAALAAGAGLRAAITTHRGRRLWDRIKLRLPVMGRAVRLIAVARFTRTLATLLAGGLPIVRALATSKDVANNSVLGDAIDQAAESITEGASLARPLRDSGEFPAMVTHMIEVGERSGELEAMLGKVADTYDEQVETLVSRLTALLEPLLILVMVGIVVVIILATLVPLLNVTTSLG
ncbi:MAG: type II secretion system inner membrane protein GspF [Myxococcota bacterium]|nr:type II secretion system inner membrane protein GspF [bacterium]MDP6074657.1 type II secretion system inner membrane protein GspF [Myxococcota bacterium]MDP6241957.1 type II secretion system inner membrane protein GspF [Myxococcota bacterium]MDP7072993.1 type II secretion system inner membrane protein GspF [Myxococcota bacterium]MDP7297787.1 type II secretion system inner membrane protein GspF [Myxococcota bacterium]